MVITSFQLERIGLLWPHILISFSCGEEGCNKLCSNLSSLPLRGFWNTVPVVCALLHWWTSCKLHYRRKWPPQAPVCFCPANNCTDCPGPAWSNWNALYGECSSFWESTMTMGATIPTIHSYWPAALAFDALVVMLIATIRRHLTQFIKIVLGVARNGTRFVVRFVRVSLSRQEECSD